MARKHNSLTSPRPFLKWAGGKTDLVGLILQKLPAEIPQYVEPFVGGGAVFFALARARRFERALLGDRNGELVLVWQTVRDDVEGLIAACEAWPVDEATYYQVRDELALETLTPTERAARVIWLNRHCFNGLYRLNRQGRFNVPFGRYARPQRIDFENLRRCSEVLQGVEIIEGDFDDVLARAEPGAAVYLDPPYVPVSKTSSFTAYDGNRFGTEEHSRLAATFEALPERGIRHAVLSNSWTDETRSLYRRRRGMNATSVQVRRSINRNGAGRAPVPELLAWLVPRPPT
ncbi:MAG: DNA adenine methylase [bacterium]